MLKLRELGDDNAIGAWKDPRHIAVANVRAAGIESWRTYLGNRNGESFDIVFVEFWFHVAPDDVDQFTGLLGVSETGVWFHDGDGDINDDGVFRGYFVPWHIVAQVKAQQHV